MRALRSASDVEGTKAAAKGADLEGVATGQVGFELAEIEGELLMVLLA